MEPCFIEKATNDQIDKGITPELASKMWRYTKENYSEKGIGFPEALPLLAQDFNLPARVISRILDSSKQVRVVTDEVSKIQRQNRKFLADNRRYIADTTKSDVLKMMNVLNEGIRGTLLGGHGPVIGAIHPIDQLFTPGRIGAFLRSYGRAVSAAKPGSVAEMFSRYEGKERWQKWQDAGLPIGRNDKIEGTSIFGWGGRSMETALKPLMYEYAEELRMRSKPELRDNPEMMKDNARQAAHASGAIVKGELGHGFLPWLYRNIQLASGLNTSRWMKTVVEPLRTANTYSQAAISKASKLLPERFQRPGPSAVERQGASNRAWQAGKWMGTMAGGLIFNDQLMRMIGSHARVNFTDPKRPDYLAFRVNIPGIGDYYIKTRGSMEVLQLIARLTQGAKPYAHGKFGETTPEETAGRYFEYKATPSLSFGKELTTGKDVFGRPVPWSSDPGTKYAPRYSSFAGGPSDSLKDRVLRGVTSPEYWGQHAPIFLGHGIQAFYEGMRDSGVDPSDVHSIMRGIQQHPEILLRGGFEGGAEFLGINPQRERGKPYVVPQAQQQFEKNYLPSPKQ